MKIFITGGTGFIGSWLTKRLLKKGHWVTILSRRSRIESKISDDNHLKMISADLLSPQEYQDKLKGIDVLFHLAAIRGERPFFKKEDYLKANTKVTEVLLKASFGKVKKFVFVSSVSAAARPLSWYGESKLLAEQIVREYQKKGLDALIIRPGIVYGPGDQGGFITQMIAFLKKGYFLKVGNGNNLYPLIFIHDLIDFFLASLKITHPLLPLLAVSPEKVSLNRLLASISKYLHCQPKVVYLPKSLALMLGFLIESSSKILKFNPPLTPDKINNLSRNWWFDARRTYQLINFTPRIGIESGLQETIDWYLKETHGENG